MIESADDKEQLPAQQRHRAALALPTTRSVGRNDNGINNRLPSSTTRVGASTHAIVGHAAPRSTVKQRRFDVNRLHDESACAPRCAAVDDDNDDNDDNDEAATAAIRGGGGGCVVFAVFESLSLSGDVARPCAPSS